MCMCVCVCVSGFVCFVWDSGLVRLHSDHGG